MHHKQNKPALFHLHCGYFIFIFKHFQLTNMSRHGQPGKRSKSCGDVWKYFLYNARRDKASCAVDFCTTIISGKKTANLRRHLQHKHPIIYAMVITHHSESLMSSPVNRLMTAEHILPKGFHAFPISKQANDHCLYI